MSYISDGSIVYQNVPSPLSAINELVQDDSPNAVRNEFWSPLGVDIPLSDMNESDFKKVRLMTDLLFLYKQRETPQKDWDKLRVTEQYTDTNGETKLSYQSYNYLWSALQLKIFLKMKRAVNGLNLKQFTENRTLSTSILEERSPQKEKKRFKVF